ncbi:hypothetical protein GF371_02085 [Candidatus Woesearchaeota archaeon]|nr:hypothetical protein [Candidatus Woesearchaeota archaeon]
MGTICDKKPILTQIERYFSTFGFIFDKFFNSRSQKINAVVVLQKLKEKTVDLQKVEAFFSSLPADRWTINTIAKKSEEINELFGMSNEEIRGHCVTEVNDKDLINLKWELQVQSMLESAKFANEYYDALKSNQNPNLSEVKMKLLNELMLVFKYIKDSSKKIFDRYEHAKYNKRNINQFNLLRFPIELLWMRTLYVLFNLKDADEKKIEELTRILATERISISHQKIQSPRFN